MAEYAVKVIIGNKPYVRDPEGETILKDLILKGGFQSVKKVRTAKLLTITLEADGAESAKATTKKLCDELRIYNPVVSRCVIEVDQAEGSRSEVPRK